jgi:biopolymer transport protein ExbB
MSLFLQKIFDELYNTYVAGGWVMIPILTVGTLGFYYLFNGYLRIGPDLFRRDFPEFFELFRKALQADDRKKAHQVLKAYPGFVSLELHRVLTHAEKRDTSLPELLNEKLMAAMNTMDKGMHMAGVMATTAPLLGLLGTVTGMVATFQVITLYGNQNPVLMADGISEALITTQSGLIIAFPLVLLKQRLEERMERIKQHMEMGATIILHHRNQSSNGDGHGSV